MSKVLKTLLAKRKSLTKDEDSRKLLVRSAEEHDQVTGGCTTQTCLNTTDQSVTDPEEHGQRVLYILKDILLEDRKSEELNKAAELVKQWAKLNGGYPQSWLREYLMIVEKSVEKHFPTMPSNGPNNPHIEPAEYLQNAKSLVCKKVIDLVNVLEDAGLLSYLVDSYNRRLFAELEMLIDRSSSMREAFLLLEWVKQTYLSHDLKGIRNNQDGVLRVSDPLLLTGWSKQKLVKLIQDHYRMSTTLQRVLQYSEAPCDYSNEEDLNKVHVDVIQCLDAAVQRTKTISHILMTAVLRVCCDELHSFVQRYVNAEKKQLGVQKPCETYLLHLFRVINDCRHLRSYALTIMDENNSRDSFTLLMLENMEAQVSVCLQKWFSGLAEEHLKKYVKEQDVHLHRLMDIIQKNLGTLAQYGNGDKTAVETKQDIVNAVYQSVTKAYLRCLMKKKYRRLEKRWSDVTMQMIKDAALIHSVFTTLGTSDERQVMCLQKVCEMLGCTGVDCLKLVCAALYKDFPKESKEHLLALLKWKRGLSKSQMKEILDAIREVCQNGDDITPRLMWWSYCFCCM